MNLDVRRRWPPLLFGVALAFRVAWVIWRGSQGLSFSDDAKAYHDLAANLVERNQFVTVIDPPHRVDIPYATRPPLTPFVLAAAYTVFGLHPLAGQLLLAALGALTTVVVYHLGKDLFSREVGVLAGLLTACYPFFVFLSAVPITENLAIPLYAFLALALVHGARSSAWHHAVVSGCLLGLAALNRPQILGFFPLLVPLVALGWGSGWSAKLRNVALMVVCWAVILAPWTIRNRVVLHRWAPVSLQGGTALLEGNNPHTQTALTQLEHGARGWYDDPRWGSDLAGLSPVEADRAAFDLALHFIRDHPARALDYAAQKLWIFFSAYNQPIAKISWYPMLAFSLLGFWCTRRDWRRLLPIHLLVAQTILTAAIFTSMPRFRAPVEPFFLLLAAVALRRWWTLWAACPGRPGPA